MKIAYLNCVGGVSGDMLLGAIVDAGVSVETLAGALSGLPVGGFTLSSRSGKRGGVNGTAVDVTIVDEGRSRTVQDFLDETSTSSLPSEVVDRASEVFRRLGEAEARAHRGDEGGTHLHELGSLDTLVDVVGVVVGLRELGVERLYASPLPTGSGVVASGHGPLPTPVPATAELLAMVGAPVVPPPAVDAGEMVTPTGAAIVTTLASFEQPAIRLERVGYGLGTRDPDAYPNVLALWLGEEIADLRVSRLSLIETNIDDMAPELMAYVQERLLDLGARDVWFTPIQMKKARPATMLSAIVSPELELKAVDLVLRETTTLGVRVFPTARYEADREIVKVDTTLGVVHVKLKRLHGKGIAVSPEYEDCRRIALDRDLPLLDVYRAVQEEASAKLL